MAGLSQGGVQVGRRKPVIQGGPAREILSESPSAGCGRTETLVRAPCSLADCASRTAHACGRKVLGGLLFRRGKVKQLRRREPQCFSQPADVEESDVPLSAFDTAQVAPRQTALKRKVFLRPPALATQIRQMFTELNSGVEGVHLWPS